MGGIYVLGDNETIRFASDELKKYLSRMSAGTQMFQTEIKMQYHSGEEALWVGQFDNFGIDCHVADHTYDDAIYINVQGHCGIISGINPRSTLIAVYRFLTEAGCRWIRPGAEGEYVPEADIGSLNIQVFEKASYRHRGICIEGAVSYENVYDMIDWLPRVGLNAYFFQFRESFTFFNRWYLHLNNPGLKPEPFSIEKAREFIKGLEKEVSKRGLIYHGVGHGWTCEPFGIPGLGWDKPEQDVLPQVKDYLAEVNGKRDFWEGIPLNTNLCYSNDTVRSMIVSDIARYAGEHPDMDLLHFWLADGSNNHCECENCKKMIPADFYVKMLNELDELLTQKGLGTKIVFLIYVDLMWPPETERINNPDRFVLMFAPITRTYSNSFALKGKIPEIPPYNRNKLDFPSSIEGNAAFLKGWQKIFKGDSFDFDYHFMWDHYLDPGYCKIARVLSEDVKNLKNLGLNGLISCQVQRSFFPNSLGVCLMGQTLWNDALGYDEVAEEYFKSAYGTDGGLCRLYLEELSQLFNMELFQETNNLAPEEQEKRLNEITGVIDRFRPVIIRNLGSSGDFLSKSWTYLMHHADICYLLVLSLKANVCHNTNVSRILWNTVAAYVREHEEELQPVLDVFEFINVLGRKFEMLWESRG